MSAYPDPSQFDDASEDEEHHRIALSGLPPQDRHHFASTHGHLLATPQHRHNMLSRFEQHASSPGEQQAPSNIAALMNLMQSPGTNDLLNSSFYRQQAAAQQRFPVSHAAHAAAYMNAGGYSSSEIAAMRYQQSQRAPPASFGFPRSSPNSSPDDFRKRAAAQAAQVAQAQAQAQAAQAQAHNYFPYNSHSLSSVSRAAAAAGAGSSFYQSSNRFQHENSPSSRATALSKGLSPSAISNRFQAAQSSLVAETTGRETDKIEDHINSMVNRRAEEIASPSDDDVLSRMNAGADSLQLKKDEMANTQASTSSTSAQDPPSFNVHAHNEIFGKNSPAPPSSGSTRGRGRGGRGRGRGGRGRGRGRGKGRGKNRVTSLTTTAPDGTIVPIRTPEEEANADNELPVWYSGSISLGLEEDQFWLSELQVFLRSNFAEAFGATERDIAAPMHGRNKPIALGQVGIRCIHCRDDPPNARGQQAVSYPSLVSGIYNSVQQMFRLHFDCCLSMPPEIRKKIEALRASSSSRGGRKQYWIDSAKRLGLVDTPHGIHFGRDPDGPLPPLGGPSAMMMHNGNSESASSKSKAKEKSSKDVLNQVLSPKTMSLLTQEHSEEMKRQKEEAYPLVLPQDKPLISDYLYLTLEQMEPCKLMDSDRVGCYKGREMGFPGLACKWCVGQAGCGRYFPASEASLSQTTTSQTILNHVRNCRRCPIECRENLELMKRSKMGPDGKRFEKPKHGGRKIFFHRLWCRIQGLPIDEIENIEVKIGRQKGAKNKRQKKRTIRKKRKYASDDETSDEESDDETDRDDEETETEDEDDDDDDDDESTAISKRGKVRLENKKLGQLSPDDESVVDSESSEEEENLSYYDGRIALSKPDDPHWLSELHTYVRSHMVEAFTLTEEDIEEGEHESEEAQQVGICCKFCAKQPAKERSPGWVSFPETMSSIYQSVSDLQRRHFLSCPHIPDDVRKSFKSLRGFSAKTEGETQQYWIDSARELGLINAPENAGVRYFRDPTTPSIADLETSERERNQKKQANENMILVRPDDKALATDHMLLLLQQVRPCRFKNSDRRGGPGSRGRDRALGFPGIACIHCSSKNNFGRYFPVAAKSLADNTANSIQTHVLNCSRCPEGVKASLAYLSHRSILQKVELGSGWKKVYFKKVWDRLHVERAWAKKGNDDNGADSPEEAGVGEAKDEDDDNSDSGLGSDYEDMAKAAATWLTERDAGNGSSQPVKRGGRGRGLLGGRGLPCRHGNTRGRGTVKRRRVLL